jgi:hypothetical protein
MDVDGDMSTSASSAPRCWIGRQVGMPPSISASFTVSDDVSVEMVERLIEENADARFTVMLLRALFQAWKIQMKIKIVGLQPKGLSATLGLPPTVQVEFA